jgi:hypothetical protein
MPVHGPGEKDPQLPNMARETHTSESPASNPRLTNAEVKLLGFIEDRLVLRSRGDESPYKSGLWTATSELRVPDGWDFHDTINVLMLRRFGSYTTPPEFLGVIETEERSGIVTTAAYSASIAGYTPTPWRNYPLISDFSLEEVLVLSREGRLTPSMDQVFKLCAARSNRGSI